MSEADRDRSSSARHAFLGGRPPPDGARGRPPARAAHRAAAGGGHQRTASSAPRTTGAAVTVELASGERLTVGPSSTAPARRSSAAGPASAAAARDPRGRRHRAAPPAAHRARRRRRRARRSRATAPPTPTSSSSAPCAAARSGRRRRSPRSAAGRARWPRRSSARRLPRVGSVRDLYGLPLSAKTDSADLYNEALGRILRVQSGAQPSLEEALRRDPDFALGHTAMAILGHEFGADVDVATHLTRRAGRPWRRGARPASAPSWRASTAGVAGDSTALCSTSPTTRWTSSP